MSEGTCEICGCVPKPVAIEQHHIVPTQITEPAGMPGSATVNLCHNCHREVHAWYSMKVANTAYDPATKRFEIKSWYERLKDYESAFKNFAKYNEQQRLN